MKFITDLWKNRRRLVLITGLFLFVLMVFAGIGGVILYKRQIPKNAAEYFYAGAGHLEQRQFERALEQFLKASDLQPDNPNFSKEAAKAAYALGRRTEAQGLAQKAWNRGLKDAEILRMIVTGYRSAGESSGLEEALKLLDQLPADDEHRELRGDIYYNFGEQEEAISIWQELVKVEPEGELIVKLCQALLRADRVEEAKTVLEGQRSENNLDESGYSLLAFMEIFRNEFEEATETFAEAAQKGHDGEGIRIQKALFNVLAQKVDEAREVLGAIIVEVEDEQSNLLRRHARIIVGYLSLGADNLSEIEEMESIASGTRETPEKEGELHFYKALRFLKEGSPEARVSLGKTRSLIRGQAIIEALYARESARAGEYEEAIEVFRGIRGIVARWPVTRYDLAFALHRNRENNEAIQILAQMHREKLISRESLKLYRDVAFELNLSDIGQASQGALEQYFPDDPGVKMYSGVYAFQQGSFEKAGAIFEELAEAYPEETRFQIGRAQVLIAGEKFEEAIELIEKSIAPYETLAPLAAVAHVNLGQWAEAEAAFERAISVNQPVAVHIEYGKLLLQLNKPEEAGAQFLSAMERDQTNLEANFGLGLIAFANQDWEEYRERARILKRSTEKLEERHLLLLVSAEMLFGNFQQALEYSKLAVEKNPESLRARFFEGRNYLSLGQIDEAEAKFREILELEPESDSVKEQLAFVVGRKGNFEEALSLAEEIIEANPGNIRIHQLRFEFTVLAGKYDVASDHLGEIESMVEPERYSIYASWLAQVQGNIEEAEALVEPYLENREATIQWARLQFEQGRETPALEALAKHTLNTQQWITLAALAEQKGLKSALLYCYSEAVKVDPDNPVVLNNWAWHSMHSSNFDQGKVVKAAKKAFGILPDNPDVLDTYSVALLRGERFPECRKVLTENMGLTLRTPQLLYHLGFVYEKIGEPDKALTAYRQCLNLLKREGNAVLREDREELIDRIDELEATQI